MSADQVNSDTIEQTKQQIRGLVSEIAQLSKSDLEAEEYYSAFLQRIVSALAAEQAGSTAGVDIAANINSVTRDGEISRATVTSGRTNIHRAATRSANTAATPSTSSSG